MELSEVDSSSSSTSGTYSLFDELVLEVEADGVDLECLFSILCCLSENDLSNLGSIDIFLVDL